MNASPYPTDAELAQFRADAELGMVDACSITRAGVGQPVFDPGTGQYTDPPRVDVYVGKCRTQVTAIIANSTDSQGGERAYRVQGSEFQLPLTGTDNVSIGDVAEITAAGFDPALVLRKFTIIARFEKTHATSRRLRVEEATG